MQQQISRAQCVFYFGLFLMLATAILSAAIWPAASAGIQVLTLVGALLALWARLRQSRLQRSFRAANGFFEAGLTR